MIAYFVLPYLANLAILVSSLAACVKFRKPAFLLWCCSSAIYVALPVFDFFAKLSPMDFDDLNSFDERVSLVAFLLGVIGTVIFIHYYARPPKFRLRRISPPPIR